MRRLLFILAAAALAAGCIDASQQPTTSTLVADVQAVTLAVGSDGKSLLWADRTTGQIMRWTGEAELAEVAQVEVSTEGQRGLLGIAEIGSAVYAAWTRQDEQMVVAQVAPGPERLVWSGFASKNGGNGGRLLATADGALLIGVGTLLRSALVDDPGALNGKMLRLDPTGPADQTPVVVSSGWNNPFAFAFANSRLWVADNHPADGDERLTWGDEPDGPVTIMPNDSAPTGLASIDGRLYVCGYNTRAIYRYNVTEAGRAIRAGTVAEDCRFDVVALGDRLVYASADSINVIDSVG